MKIELFYAPGCTQCADNRDRLKTAAQQAADIDWYELDVMANLDHAVDLGVLTLPAIAIDGVLEFPSLPSEKQLLEAIVRRASTREKS